MWRRLVSRPQQCRAFHVSTRVCSSSVIKIDNATFHRRYPTPDDTPESNPPLFPDLTFRLWSGASGQTGAVQNWAILSPSSLARTTFLQILAGQHISIPPTARTYPYLSERQTSPQHAIRYVGFDAERGSSVGGTNVRGAYLSARYESRREETDYSLLAYLTGNTELNAVHHDISHEEQQILDQAIDRLNLGNLLQMPVANLSNGQTRRARIAKALMARPEVLLLDGPFMGLDPRTAGSLDGVLRELTERQDPRLILSLRPEDGIPDWITHLVVTDESLRVLKQESKKVMFRGIRDDPSFGRGVGPILRAAARAHDHASVQAMSKDGFPQQSPPLAPGEALVEMNGVKVAYGDKVVLGDWTQEDNKPGLWWSLHRGQRAGIFGPNGSGKTTMLSLITSDHPQTYALPIKLFGRSRLPGPNEPGISLFDIQRRMGHSSPEVHAFFPKNLTVRRAIESAWADAPMARAKLTAEADRKVDAFLRWFARDLHPSQPGKTIQEMLEDAYHLSGHYKETSRLDKAASVHEDAMCEDLDLEWADKIIFRELSFSSQRLVLFLRALVHSPDLVILDEALSGIDERVRDKALLFLSQGEKVARVENGEAVPSVLAHLGKPTFEGLTPQQALLVISHSKEDVPGCVREWICLPDPGEGRTPRIGKLDGPLELQAQGWSQIWGQA